MNCLDQVRVQFHAVCLYSEIAQEFEHFPATAPEVQDRRSFCELERQRAQGLQEFAAAPSKGCLELVL